MSGLIAAAAAHSQRTYTQSEVDALIAGAYLAATKITAQAAFEYLDMHRTQKMYGWHDVSDALEKGTAAGRAAMPDAARLALEPNGEENMHKHCVFCGEQVPCPRPTAWSTICKSDVNTGPMDTVGNRHHAVLIGRQDKYSFPKQPPDAARLALEEREKAVEALVEKFAGYAANCSNHESTFLPKSAEAEYHRGATEAFLRCAKEVEQRSKK